MRGALELHLKGMEEDGLRVESHDLVVRHVRVASGEGKCPQQAAGQRDRLDLVRQLLGLSPCPVAIEDLPLPVRQAQPPWLGRNRPSS